jgi:hypothetical protein
MSKPNLKPRSSQRLFFDCERLEDRQLLTTINVYAAGATNQESIQLRIDDAVVQTWNNLGGNADSGQFVELTYSTAQIVEPSQIKIAFTNDAIVNGADRNVRVDRIVVDGQTVQTESALVFSTGTWKPADGVSPGFRQSEYLHANGYFQYPSSPGGSEIQIRVRGDEGSERFNLLVGGQVVGNYGASTSWSTTSYTHYENVAADDVRIEFINSEYDVAQNIDSNLNVDYIRVDGATYQTSESSVFSTGTWTSGDGIVPGFGRGERLHANGYFQYATQNQTGSEVMVRVKGTEGSERFNLIINGQVVRTFAVNETTDFQLLGYRHSGNVAPEDVRIEFINDQWNPALGIDANLTVDYLVVDGKAYQTENPAVYSTGSWRPEDGIVAGNRESETLNANGYFQFADTNYLNFTDTEGDGEWSDVHELGLIPIHAIVLPDGKVFSFGTDERGMQGGEFIYSLYDPATGQELMLPNTTDTDIFCSNMSIDPATGNVLITGGDARGEGGPVNGPINDVLVFDYDNLTLRDATQGEMEYARWYGSSITLSNGEIMVMGGTGGGKDVPEVFNATTGWRTLTGVDVNINYYYPKTWVTSDGRVVLFTGTGSIYRINTAGSGSSELIGSVNAPHSVASPGVMYDTDKIAIIGTDAKIYTADLRAANPAFTAVADVIEFRRDGGMSVLPDGRVALTGGSRSFNVLSTTVYVTEIWDPRTNTVEEFESVGLGRLYHSTHILLPDGTVWVGGGGAPGPLQNLNVEFFAPDYLYGSDGVLADRPVITSAPTNVENNSTFQINVSDANSISRVTAVRAGALTHGVNNDTRFVELEFSVVDGETLQVTSSSNNIMVPGNWMLFVLDENGVPSVASMLGVAMTPLVDTPHIV